MERNQKGTTSWAMMIGGRGMGQGEKMEREKVRRNGRRGEGEKTERKRRWKRKE